MGACRVSVGYRAAQALVFHVLSVLGTTFPPPLADLLRELSRLVADKVGQLAGASTEFPNLPTDDAVVDVTKAIETCTRSMAAASSAYSTEGERRQKLAAELGVAIVRPSTLFVGSSGPSSDTRCCSCFSSQSG
jgi:hypothetical protein